MIVVDKTIVSDDLVKVHFVCDLNKCLGVCCVEGDAGAPVDEMEVGEMEDALDMVKPYMTSEGIDVVENFGVIDYDADGKMVTPLINDCDCAYLSYDGTIAKCAFEKAYFDHKIKFRKPISCHLYPVRITEHADFDAVNYHKWHICKTACNNGQSLQIPLYKYLEEPLIRKYGRKWYKDLLTQIQLNEKK